MSAEARYKIVVGDNESAEDIQLVFHYRLLGREEYEGLLQHQMTEEELLESICYLCVEEDYPFSEGLAGIPEVIGNAILEGSGYLEGQPEFLLNLFRAEVNNNPNVQRDCIIAEAFPNIDIEEIAGWPLVKQLFYYSRAEYIMALRGRPIREIAIEEQQVMQKVSQAKPQPVTMEDVSFKPAPQTAPKPAKEANPQRELSEQEVMAMLGVDMSTIATDVDHEGMRYYAEKDRLTGDFD